MLIDRPQVTEGSSIVKATVPSGPTLPLNPNRGELFYLTAANGGLQAGFVVYNNSAWKSVYDQTLSQSPGEHIADSTIHVSSAQKNLLNSLTATAVELNYVDGVTSPIQTQLNDVVNNLNTEISTRTTADNNLTSSVSIVSGNLTTHIGDGTKHLTTAQNALLDGLAGTLTATELNYVDGVTSPIQPQIDTLSSTVSGHISSTPLHLTAAQSTLLDGLAATLTATELNYVDGVTSPIQTQLNTLSSTRVSKAGDTMNPGASLTFNGGTVTGLPSPTNSTDAANKDYVDSIVQGLSWKDAVRVATTANITLSGLQTIDGVSLVANDRVLVKNQTTTSQNGIYIVASTAWSRAPDASTATELNGASVFVTDGTAGQDTAWVQTQTITTLGTSSVVWSQFAAAGGATAGQGISITGSVISVRAGNGLTFSGQDLTLNTSTEFVVGTQLSLAASGVSAGTYGSSTLVPVVSVDDKGRVTNVTTANIGSSFQALDADLTAIAGLSSTGLLARTAANTWAQVSIASSGVGISINNGNGVGGNPTVVSNATNANTPSTIVYRDASGNFAAGTITATLNGNASTATTATTATSANTLTTARTIGLSGVTATAQSFNGSSNITIPITAVPTSLLTGTIADGLISGSYTGIASLTMTGNVNFDSTGDRRIQITGTSDGADTGRLLLLSGGSVTATRGAYIVISGNESTTPGALSLVSGETGGVTINGGTSGTTVTGTGGLVVSSGTIAGNGADITGLNASNLSTGTVPTGRLTGTYGISISGNAATASAATQLQTARTFSITGAASAAGISFNGTGNVALSVTDLNATSLSSGTVPNARITGAYTGFTSITGTGTATFATFSGSGASLTALNASNLSSGTVPDARISGAYTGITNLSLNNLFVSNDIRFSGSTSVIYNTLTDAYMLLSGGSTSSLGANIVMYGEAHSTTADTGRMRVDATTVAQWTSGLFAVTGAITATGDITAFSSSDARIKKDVETIPNALSKVEKLRGVTYTRISNDRRETGVIAQDVLEVLPEAVRVQVGGEDEGMYGVAYGNMVGLLIEAIKELKAEIEELKASRQSGA